MLDLLDRLKGVILLFIVLVCVSNMITTRVKELNQLDQANSIAYYEKSE